MPMPSKKKAAQPAPPKIAPRAAKPKVAAKRPVTAVPKEPKAASVVIGNLSLVTIHVSDFDRALRFYRDTLGLKQGETVPQANWVEFNVGPVTLGLHCDPTEEGARPPGHSTGFYFQVSDVDRSVAMLRERGVKIADEPADKPYGRDATFVDPDGNLLALVTPKGP